MCIRDRYWDPLLAADKKGLLRKLMEECVDGEYQNFKAKGLSLIHISEPTRPY